MLAKSLGYVEKDAHIGEASNMSDHKEVFGDVTVVNGACLATREDDVAAVVGVCGKKGD